MPWNTVNAKKSAVANIYKAPEEGNTPTRPRATVKTAQSREEELATGGKCPSKMEERPWYSMNIGELKLFIGLQILMGVYDYPAIADYWGDGVKHPEFHQMSCNRYQQIKRYFHLSPPDGTYPRAEWWRKMEPLASHLRRLFEEYYLPGSNVAFDEMMVLCKGRTFHTIKMPNKPIDEGYKLYALCEKGYTYSFLFYSGETKNENSAFTQETVQFTQPHPMQASSTLDLVDPVKEFSPTIQAVCHLVFRLPFQEFQFNVYMDNYFSTIPLFRHLRSHGIGAAGTTRPGRADFPSELALDKSLARRILQWNHLSGIVVDGVCSVLWQDNNMVLFLTTIHDVRQLVLANRRRPKKTVPMLLLLASHLGNLSTASFYQFQK